MSRATKKSSTTAIAELASDGCDLIREFKDKYDKPSSRGPK